MKKFIKLKNLINDKSLYWVYVILMGLVFVFVIPPFQKADEVYHYFHTYSVSGKGKCDFSGSGSMILPMDVVNFSEKMKSGSIAFNYQNKFPKSVLFDKYNLKSNEKTTYNKPCVKFGVLAYLPNIIGIKIGGSNLLLAFYLSRLFGFLVFLATVVISLKLSGKYFPLIIAFSVIPMVIHQVTAISYDSFHISLGLLSFSFYIYLKNNFSRVKPYLLFLFYVLLLVFILTKGGYYLLLVLPFLLPTYPFFKKNIKNTIVKFLILIAYFLLIFFLLRSIVVSFSNAQDGLINSFLQKKIVLENPLYFIQVLNKTTSDNFYFYWTSFLGNFGWLDYGTQFSIYLLETFFILCIVSNVKFNKNKQNKLKISDILELIFIFGIVIGTYVIIQTSLYLAWTPLAGKIVSGVQGRYLFILFLFLIYGLVRFVEIFGIKRSKIVLTVITFILVISNITKSVYLRYYDYSSSYSNVNELGLDNYKDYKKNNSGYKVIPVVDNKICENIGDNKIGGFAIYFANNIKETEYVGDVFKYDILDGDKILNSGYLDQTKIQTEGVYIEEFKKILNHPNNNNICIRLYKKYSQQNNNPVLYFIEKDGISAKFLKISK